MRISIGKLEGKNHLVDLGLDGRILLKCILQEFNMKIFVEFK